jgi:hypothetical protein
MGKRTGESILGIVGGGLGVFVGLVISYLGTFGMGNMPAEAAGIELAILGIIGFAGGVVVGRTRLIGGILMLIGGVLGFFIISAFWIIPGIIMIIGGLLTFKKPKVMQTRVEEGQGVV